MTTNFHDGLNRLVKVVNPGTTDVGIRYTSTGLQWQTTNELDRVTTVEYDLAGRPVKTISPELEAGVYAITETGYDDNGNVWWVEDANGNITTNLYDYRNRLVETIAPAVVTNWTTFATAQPTITTIYDGVGNVISVTDAEGNTTTNFYDANNRMFATWAPEVSVYVDDTTTISMRPTTTNTFDKAGNIITTRDANGKEVDMYYDLFGRLTNTVDAVGNTISFEYDKSGNQTALIDGKNNETEFEYDGLNRKTSTIYPNDKHEDAEYDLVGNRIKRIDCNNIETQYDYDLRNRLDLVTYPTYIGHPSYPVARTRDYAYDLAGNLTNVTESADANAAVSYAYDALNRVTNETSVGVTHQYKYDLLGNRTNAVYGLTGREVDWEYDALNRITNIIDGANATAYGYDLNSKPVYREYPTGVEEVRTFDAMGRLLTMTNTLSDTSDWLSMTYQYDAVGSARYMWQWRSSTLADEVQRGRYYWDYDDRYRLTNEAFKVVGQTKWENRYIWDSADNRLSMTEYTNGTLKATTTYVVNSLNQTTSYSTTDSESASISATSLSYDYNGNRVGKVAVVYGEGTFGTAYSYDEDNRLISVGPSTETDTHRFKYDYRSRRIYRSTPSTSHMYCIFDGGLSVQEYEPATANLTSTPLVPSGTGENLRTEFIRGEGMGGGVGGMVYSIEDGDIKCSHANHRGDVIARTDNTGSLTYFALYEAYGTRPYEYNPSGDPDRQKANTKEEEADLGLLNEGMRYRDLETGTFLTRDPIGYKDGPNLYCYVHCNPITRFDPLGLRAYGSDYEGDLTEWDWIDETRTQEEVQTIYDELNERDAVVYCPGLGNTASDRKENAKILSQILGINVIATVENPTFKAGGEVVGDMGDKLGAGNWTNPLRAPGNLVGLAGNILSKAGVALDVGVAGVQKLPGGKVVDPAYHDAQEKFSAAEKKVSATGGTVLAFMHSEGGIYGENAMTEKQKGSFSVHTLGSGGYASGFKDVQDVTHHVNLNLSGRADFVPAIAGGIDFGNQVETQTYTVSTESRTAPHGFMSYARTAIMDVGRAYYNANK